MQDRVLRCYAESSDSGWEAICVDLDLAAQGSSFEEARDALYEAISVYLETVMELPDEKDRVRLLNRRAPLLTIARLEMAHLGRFLLGRGKIRHDFTTTPEACLP